MTAGTTEFADEVIDSKSEKINLKKSPENVKSNDQTPRKMSQTESQSGKPKNIFFTPEKKNSPLPSNSFSEKTGSIFEENVKVKDILLINEEHDVHAICESYIQPKESNKFNDDKTPEKSSLKKHLFLNNSGDESQFNLEENAGEKMMTEVEQAKQLIIDSENYLKSLEKTPVKQNTQNSSNMSKYSPGTPNAHKRVNLITLDSPKTKKFKPSLN